MGTMKSKIPSMKTKTGKTARVVVRAIFGIDDVRCRRIANLLVLRKRSRGNYSGGWWRHLLHG
jgi:hypothetical protein